MEEDDLREALAENAASLKEIDEALATSPTDEDLIQVGVRLPDVGHACGPSRWDDSIKDTTMALFR